MNEKTLIVTFECENDIYVYGQNCGKIPRMPYTRHASIDDAEHYQRIKGFSPKCVIYPPKDYLIK